jgi:hypothetical protein
MTTTSTAEPRRYPGRLFIALGFALTALGIVAYVVQIAAEHLKMPWYLPISGILGAVCAAIALWQARSVWRVLALILLVLVAGLEGAFLFAIRLPPYTGTRVAAGKPFPAFATSSSEGTSFTQSDLEGDRDTVMVFFRGRW